jgi:hypothetical protein
MDINRFVFGGIGHVLLIAGFNLGVLPSVQAFEATAEQQQACEPDAFRLCSSEIPDAARVAACMRVNEESLSPPCRAVFQDASLERSAPLQHRRRTQHLLSEYTRD